MERQTEEKGGKGEREKKRERGGVRERKRDRQTKRQRKGEVRYNRGQRMKPKASCEVFCLSKCIYISKMRDYTERKDEIVRERES